MSRQTVVVMAALLAAACGGLDDPGMPCPPGRCDFSNGQSGSGGGALPGGTGGAQPGSGGAPATGGAAQSGGAPATGGTPATGGAPQTGGAPATGGAPQTGGAPATGGSSGGGAFGNTRCPTFPSPSGTTPLSSTRDISGTFDGENQRFIGEGELGSSGQAEGQDPLFDLANGATLRNVIIGAPAADGIHCSGSCTLENVWFEDVGEDAVTAEGSSSSTTVTIDCGGAKQATDKVIQHNGGGTVIIRNFTAESFDKLYRSCGNCGDQYPRHVRLENVTTRGGDTLVGINSNYDDTATFVNILLSGGTDVCELYEGNSSGAEPESLGTSMDGVHCIYTSSDVHYQ